MTGIDLLGWIIIGLLAGSISGWFVGTRSVQGCLPTIVVGILGAVVGGWLTRGSSARWGWQSSARSSSGSCSAPSRATLAADARG